MRNSNWTLKLMAVFTILLTAYLFLAAPPSVAGATSAPTGYFVVGANPGIGAIFLILAAAAWAVVGRKD